MTKNEKRKAIFDRLVLRVSSSPRTPRRRKAFDIISSRRVCKLCNYDDERALVFDHVNDDGAEHRKEIGQGIVSWILRNPEIARRRIQILCANCNAVKEYERRKRKRENETPVRGVTEATIKNQPELMKTPDTSPLTQTKGVAA